MTINQILVGLLIACAVFVPFAAAEMNMTSNDTVITPMPTISQPVLPTMTVSLGSTQVIRGDPISISGATTGEISRIAVWVIGDNQGTRYETTPSSDGKIAFVLEPAMTSLYKDGLYHVIVQHPGLNNQFDVNLENTGKGYAMTGQDKKYLMNLHMPYSTGSLRGEDAKWTVMEALKTSDDLTQEFTITFVTPTPTPTPAPTATPTPTPTLVPTTVITTIIPTQTTVVPTTVPVTTTVPTTIVPTVTVTPSYEQLPLKVTEVPENYMSLQSTPSVDEKIEDLYNKVETQQTQIDNQQSILDQIMAFLTSIFNWS